MPKPLLSICIPTRNRRTYLQAALQTLLAPNPFPFEIEIIVSDNAGDDDSGTMVGALIASGAPIRYFRQERDLGVIANMYSAFRRAEGEFAIYLADDDRLLADNLARSVMSLRASPQIVALYAPWESFDAAANTLEGVTFMLNEDVEFGPNDRLALLDLLLRKSIMPEVPLIRSAAFGNSLFGSTNIYWAYLMIDRLLESGAVKFTNLPYYRSISRHWADETRSTVTQRNSLGEWDTYRRGLDYLFWRARSSPSAIALSTAEENDFKHRIAEQGRHFLANAFGGRLMNHDYKGAAEIATLLAAENMPPIDPPVRDSMVLFAAADMALEVLDLLSELSSVATFGFPTPQSAAALLLARRPQLVVETIADIDDARFRSDFLVLAIDESRRVQLLERGFAPGRVINFTRLLGFVSLPEAPAGGAVTR